MLLPRGDRNDRSLHFRIGSCGDELAVSISCPQHGSNRNLICALRAFRVGAYKRLRVSGTYRVARIMIARRAIALAGKERPRLGSRNGTVE